MVRETAIDGGDEEVWVMKTKKAGAAASGLLFYRLDVYRAVLQGNDVFSLRPFLAVHLGEADALSFRQGLESLA